jgi:hydrogenase maturation protease
MSRILVAGIGNVFLGDDGFGVAVARLLSTRSLPADVKVVDFGIRGLDLTFALLEGFDAAVLIDATRRGGPPGTLYVLEPEVGSGVEHQPGGVTIDMHAMDPARVLALVRSLGGNLGTLRVVGCEPGTLGEADDLAPGLSVEVLAAIGPAAALVERLVLELCEGNGKELACTS